MKFLYLTDSHVRGLTPSGRNGSFEDDMYAKFQEIIEIGNREEVDFYVHGGDFFDIPNVSLGVCDRFVDLIESSGKKWNVIFGNHDQIGHNTSLSGQSVLGHLFRRCKSIVHLQTPVVSDNCSIVGFDYMHNIESYIKDNGLYVQTKSDFNIIVVHAYVLPDDIGMPFEHVRYSELKTNANMVLLSHYHGDNGVYTREDGVTFVSVGSLARMTLAKIDVDRIPKVAIIDTDLHSVEIVELTRFRPKEDVFKLDLKVSDDIQAGMMDDFIRSIESAKFQGLNLRSVIESVAKQSDCPRKVVDEVINRISTFENVKE